MAGGKKNIDQRRLRSSNITVVISIALVLFLIGITGLIMINIQNYTNYLKEQYLVEVYLKEFVDKKDEAQIQMMQQDYFNTIRNNPYVKKAEYVTKEQAYKIAKNELGPDMVNMIEENIFPSSVKVYIRSEYVSQDKINTIVKELQDSPIVDEVKKDDSPVEVYQKINKLVMWLSVLSVIFLLIAIVLINNSIRLRIFSKRFLIKTMQLVGAKKSFIIKPFLQQALILGLLGAIIAILLLMSVWYYFTANIHINFVQDQTEYMQLGFIILLIGVGITCLSTYFAANRFLRLRIDDLYYS